MLDPKATNFLLEYVNYQCFYLFSCLYGILFTLKSKYSGYQIHV